MSKHKNKASEPGDIMDSAEAVQAPDPARQPAGEDTSSLPTEAPAGAGREVELRELQEQLLYVRAEQENFKKRTEKRYREMLEYAAEPLLKDLIPVLDNLERAAAHAHQGGAEGFSALLEGLDHVLSQFRETLARHGAEPVPTQDARFDPAVHDALAQVPGETDGMVADVYEKGYRFKARLLRPAKVTVTKVAPPPSDG